MRVSKTLPDHASYGALLLFAEGSCARHVSGLELSVDVLHERFRVSGAAPEEKPAFYREADGHDRACKQDDHRDRSAKKIEDREITNHANFPPTGRSATGHCLLLESVDAGLRQCCPFRLCCFSENVLVCLDRSAKVAAVFEQFSDLRQSRDDEGIVAGSLASFAIVVDGGVDVLRFLVAFALAITDFDWVAVLIGESFPYASIACP